MSPREKENTERINVFFSADALEKLKSEASARGMSVSGLIRFIVLEWLRRDAEGGVCDGLGRYVLF